MEVWRRGREAERGPEYQPLPAGTGGRDSGTESSADSHPFQELAPYVLITRLPGKRQQDCHGGAGEITAPDVHIWSLCWWFLMSLVLFSTLRCLLWRVMWERHCARSSLPRGCARWNLALQPGRSRLVVDSATDCLDPATFFCQWSPGSHECTTTPALPTGHTVINKINSNPAQGLKSVEAPDYRPLIEVRCGGYFGLLRAIFCFWHEITIYH